VLFGLLTVGAVSIIFAQPKPQQRAPVTLEIEKLKDNLYLITGAGGKHRGVYYRDGRRHRGHEGSWNRTGNPREGEIDHDQTGDDGDQYSHTL
jgi:hypothetical protein